MGMDEALLLASGAPPTLRIYQWQPAGLSIGYFQSSSDFAEVDADHVLVRRLTGGGAILHDQELTFSLTLNARFLPSDIPSSYGLIHRAVRSALGEVGVRAEFADPSTSHPTRPRPTTPWCFADPTPQDLLSSSGKKLLGSAQRRIRRPLERVLHHGSLVLRSPKATPFCGSVEETADPAALIAPLQAALISSIAAALKLSPAEGTASSAEQQNARRLAKERYAKRSFTHRR
jgi:lipoate-protein ligase A